MGGAISHVVMKLFGLYIPQSQPKKYFKDAGVAPRILSVGIRCRWMVLEVILGVVLEVV